MRVFFAVLVDVFGFPGSIWKSHMMKKTLFIAALFLPAICYGQVNLVLSSNLHVEVQQPTEISHVDNVLIFKYPNWYFSEERLNPKKVYSAVDLTGLEQRYFQAVFNSVKRKSLPAWLAALAKEQAASFGIRQKNWEHRSIGAVNIFAIFNKKEKEGNIFFLSKKYVLHIQFFGSAAKYKSFLSAVSER